MGKTQEGGCLCWGKKQWRTEWEAGLFKILGVEFSRMEISRVGVGGISSPELGQAQRLVGRFSSSELGGSSEPRNELGHFTQQK